MVAPAASAAMDHTAKLTTQISQGCPLSAVDFPSAPNSSLRDSSPPQWPQMYCAFAAQSGQKVNSNAHRYNSPWADSACSQESQVAFAADWTLNAEFCRLRLSEGIICSLSFLRTPVASPNWASRPRFDSTRGGGSDQ